MAPPPLGNPGSATAVDLIGYLLALSVLGSVNLIGYLLALSVLDSVDLIGDTGRSEALIS